MRLRGWRNTVGFHNFNLRIVNLRVSNPNKLIVDAFVDTMSDFNVPGSRPNKITTKFRKSTVWGGVPYHGIIIIIIITIIIIVLSPVRNYSLVVIVMIIITIIVNSSNNH